MRRPLTVLPVLLVVACLISVGSSITFGQTLWQGSEYGMTPAEVQSVLPNAVKPSDPKTFSGDARELLRIEDIEIKNLLFDARFVFKGEKLVSVILGYRGNTLPSNQYFEPSQEASSLFFFSVRKLLRVKYGPEIDGNYRESEFMVTGDTLAGRGEATWMSGRTSIVLSFWDSTFLYVVYSVGEAVEADKL